MSLSNPQTKNPATRFMQWRGGAEKISETVDGKKSERYEGGKLTYYDKEAEENIEVPLPFSFIILDELATITGFNEATQSGFWSNEVRNTQTEDLVVRTKNGIVAKGKYGVISEGIKAKGAKYAISAYIAFKDDTGELAIGNLKIAGAALSAWLDFKKKFDVSKCAVFITDEPKLDKKGSNYYFTPVFDGQNMSEATRNAAIKLDQELQSYLSTYLSRKPDANDDELIEDEDVEIENVDEPVTLAGEEANTPQTESGEAPAEPAQPAPKTESAAKPKADEKKINLSDVPF